MKGIDRPQTVFLTLCSLFCVFSFDRDDAFQRDMERRKRRAERGGADGGHIHDESEWRLESEAKAMPLLKRNPYHGVFKVSGRSSPRRTRLKTRKRGGRSLSSSPNYH